MGIAIATASVAASTAQAQAAAQGTATDDSSAFGLFSGLLTLQIGQWGERMGLDSAQTDRIAQKAEATDDNHDDASPTDPLQILGGMLSLDPVALKSGISGRQAEGNGEQGKEKPNSALVLASGNPGSNAAFGATDDAQPGVQDALSALTRFDTTGGSEPAKTAAAVRAEQASGVDTSALSAFASTLNQKQETRTESPAAQAHVSTPLHDAGWSGDFSSKVVWLAKNDLQHAEISINPPALGPVQISLSLNGDQASAAFSSPHLEVRQLIQEAIPQLREMLAGAGIDLGQTNVGAQLAQQGQQQGSARGGQTRTQNDNAILAGETGQTTVTASTATLRSGNGMVDLFA